MVASETLKSYYEGLIALQDAILCEDNKIISISGFDCEENVTVPLAAFIEWASSNWCGHLALIFPTVEQAWSALDKVEAFMGLSIPLIRKRDRALRRFCVGNTWFTICSLRTKEPTNIDVSGGMFIYRVDHPKISKMYSQMSKKETYKIVSVKSANWLNHIPKETVVEKKRVEHITTQYVNLSGPRYFSLSFNHEQGQEFERMRVSGNIRGYRKFDDNTVNYFDDKFEGMYWMIQDWRIAITNENQSA